MAKTDPKKSKSPSKTKAKTPLKKVQKPKSIAKRAGTTKKTTAKKNAKSTKVKTMEKTVVKKSSAKKMPAKKTKTSAAVKKKATVKPKAKASKKSPAKSRSKSPTKQQKRTGKNDVKKTTKKTVPPKVKKQKAAATKKKVAKTDNKKKPVAKKVGKKVVSTKKKKTPVKKSTPKKSKTVKSSTPAKKQGVEKKPKQSLKSKPKQTKAIKTKARAQKLVKSVKKVSGVKKSIKSTKVAKQSKGKSSVAKLKATKKDPRSIKLIKSTKKPPKKGSKATSRTKTTAKKLARSTPKKQMIKSKTLTAIQKEKLKKMKAIKKQKAAKAKSTDKKTGKGKENKAPVRKRKIPTKDSEKTAKKIKLSDRNKTKKNTPLNKVQKQKLKVSIKKKKATDSAEKKTTKKLTLGVNNQKNKQKGAKKVTEKKSPLKQSKTAALKQNKAVKPQTTPKKKKAKTIDDIGNWSPSIPAVSTASPVWGYTPPGNFGKKSMIVHQDMAAQGNKKIVNPSKIKVSSGTSFNIRTPGDQKAVWITGMAVFPNNQLIMCDIQNLKLKLFDASSFKLLSFATTGKLPQDISVSALNPTDAYFTLNFDKIIQKCSITDGKIALGEKFSVNGCCRGIVCTTNGIITSVENTVFMGYQIQIRDYDGTIMRTISNMSSSLFSHPICFDITSDGDRIVISDCALMSSTICLDINGKQIYKFNRIPRQRGISLDEGDNAYLPDHSNTSGLVVKLLSADGREVKDLITKETKGVKENLTKPYQIVYHRLKGIPMLFLSVQENGIMYAFKLSS